MFGIKLFHYYICIMHIYVERMHALIHICRVLHNKTFSKNPTILLEGIKSVNDEIIKKITLSNPN